MIYINALAKNYEIIEDSGLKLLDLGVPPEVFEIDTKNKTYSLIPFSTDLKLEDIKDVIEDLR